MQVSWHSGSQERGDEEFHNTEDFTNNQAVLPKPVLEDP